MLLLYGRIPQNQAYHNFADQRSLFGIPHFMDVVTNLPFALIGVLGLGKVGRLRDQRLKSIFTAIFASFLLLTIGSGYYHLYPNHNTLIYDRIPITIVLMSFFSFIIYDCISPEKGYPAFFILTVMGVLSVLYWAITEYMEKGDVRWYALVQFFPIMAIPLLLWLYKPSFNYTKEIVWMFLFFGLAKLCESFDKAIYHLFNQIISGHSVKHLFMAAAGYEIVIIVKKSLGIKSLNSPRQH